MELLRLPQAIDSHITPDTYVSNPIGFQDHNDV